MRRLLVVALVLLAGCSGVYTDEPTRETPEVTAAPVPETTPEIALPRTEDDRPAVGPIIASHREELSTRSFHLRIERNGGQSRTDVWVDREADRLRIKRVRNGSVDDTLVADGTRYELRENGSVTSESTGWEDPYLGSTTGFFILQRHVAGLTYERAGTVRRTGTVLAVVRANATDLTSWRSGFRTVVAADSTLYVDRDGIVRYVDHEERLADGSVRTIEMRVTTGVRTPLPEWYERR